MVKYRCAVMAAVIAALVACQTSVQAYEPNAKRLAARLVGENHVGSAHYLITSEFCMFTARVIVRTEDHVKAGQLVTFCVQQGLHSRMFCHGKLRENGTCCVFMDSRRGHKIPYMRQGQQIVATVAEEMKVLCAGTLESVPKR